MAAGYAARLTKGYAYGKCGLPEHHDSARRRELGISRLVELIRSARDIVVHTGAGISTSCGIPDFRGPKGVWTLERQGKLHLLNDSDTKWESVRPSITHMAIYSLFLVGKVKFIVTQNVDGLHLRSGMPRDRVAELHGNVFKEVCSTCNAEYFRPFDVEGMGFRPTGRKCELNNCNGLLKDELLDWDDALPEIDLDMARKHCKAADLSLCLGTSLRVMPANELPMVTKNARGTLALVNLQNTQIDGYCDARLFDCVDSVMLEVMKRLNIPIVEYDATMDFVISKSTLTFTERRFADASPFATTSPSQRKRKRSIKWSDSEVPNKKRGKQEEKKGSERNAEDVHGKH